MAYCIQCGHKAERKIPEGDHNIRLVCPNCDYIHYENPKVICGALVTYQSEPTSPTSANTKISSQADSRISSASRRRPKVLLCRRAIEPRYGYWTLPAGFMEIGETTAEGAARETVEEADAIATNLHLYCLYDIPAIGQVYNLYLADLKDGKFGIGPESLECALFDEADIPWDDLAFEAVRRTLCHYFADRKQLEASHAGGGQPDNDSVRYDFSDFPLHQEVIEKDKRIP